jgi:aspartate aminotransferase-like enzyme
LPYASRSGAPSPTVSCLAPPPGVPARAFVTRLAELGFTVGGGYGDWKESTFRIGHMGEVGREDLLDFFRVAASTLNEWSRQPALQDS